MKRLLLIDEVCVFMCIYVFNAQALPFSLVQLISSKHSNTDSVKRIQLFTLAFWNRYTPTFICEEAAFLEDRIHATCVKCFLLPLCCQYSSYGIRVQSIVLKNKPMEQREPESPPGEYFCILFPLLGIKPCNFHVPL